MRYVVIAVVVALAMIATGGGLWQVKLHFDLPQWTVVIIFAATIWVAQWVAKEVDTRLFK